MICILWCQEGFFNAKLLTSVRCWAVIERYSKSHYILSWITQSNKFGNKDQSSSASHLSVGGMFSSYKTDLGETVAVLCELRMNLDIWLKMNEDQIPK